MILVTPKAAAKNEQQFNKPASELCRIIVNWPNGFRLKDLYPPCLLQQLKSFFKLKMQTTLKSKQDTNSVKEFYNHHNFVGAVKLGMMMTLDVLGIFLSLVLNIMTLSIMTMITTRLVL